MRGTAPRTHVQQLAQRQSTSKRHPEPHCGLSCKHQSQLSERRQSAPRVLKVFLEARSPGRARDKCSTKSGRQFSSSPNRPKKTNRKDILWSLSPTVKRPASLQRQQMWRSSTLSEPARAERKEPSVSKNLFGRLVAASVHVGSGAFFASSRVVNALTERRGERRTGVAGTSSRFPRLLTSPRKRSDQPKERNPRNRVRYILCESNI